jgi:hypothetical protein
VCRECEIYKNERVYKDYNFCPTCGSRLKDEPVFIPMSKFDDPEMIFIKPDSVRRRNE